jgi:hypothetical protein
MAKAGEWQPIETAPKDGSEFQAWLVTDKVDGFWEPKARFDPESEAFELWGRTDYDQEGWDIYPDLKPTHWMPLPAPPNAASHNP